MVSKDQLANTIWSACDIMRRDDGTTGIMEYMEQLSWLLFLKQFEAIEQRLALQAEFDKREYSPIIAEEYRWSAWTHLTGDDLIDFIDRELFPYLKKLGGTPEREIVKRIFEGIRGNRMVSGYNLADVIEKINQVDFNDEGDTHTVSLVYEDLLSRLGREGGIAGEFYTPRPIIEFMVQVIDPQIGETIYDPFVGSAGFLVESYKHMSTSRDLTIKDYDWLQRRAFWGQEKKPLPALLGMMNMLLHGVLAPNMIRTNTLEENNRNVPPDRRFDVVLTNPPFGGTENPQVQSNFQVQVTNTELLSLQHVMSHMKIARHARCGIVVPEGILFRGDAFATVKEDLLRTFNVYAIVSLPAGVFANVTSSGTGPKTDLIFFDRSGPTREIWYYEAHAVGYTLTKTQRPIAENDLPEALEALRERRIIEGKSWVVPVEGIVERGYDMTARNPYGNGDMLIRRTPEEIAASIADKETRIAELIGEIQDLLEGSEYE